MSIEPLGDKASTERMFPTHGCLGVESLLNGEENVVGESSRCMGKSCWHVVNIGVKTHNKSGDEDGAGFG